MPDQINNTEAQERQARLASTRYRQSVAKQLVKNQAKKKVKKVVKKRILQFLISSFPIWGPIFGIILICLFAFIMLVYYTCEGGGTIAWILRRTALGNLCSM